MKEGGVIMCSGEVCKLLMKTIYNFVVKKENGVITQYDTGGGQRNQCERDFPFLAAMSSSRSDIVTKFVILLVTKEILVVKEGKCCLWGCYCTIQDV